MEEKEKKKSTVQLDRVPEPTPVGRQEGPGWSLARYQQKAHALD